MSKAPVVEENELRHMFKVASVSGDFPVRDVAILYLLYGTGCSLTESASLLVRDYLNADGSILVESRWRAEITYNSKPRPLYWSNAKVTAAIDAYLDERFKRRHGITVRSAAFRGLDPDGPLLRRDDGEPYQLMARKTSAGVISYSCDSLSQRVRKLHAQAGVKGANARSARRTFGVRLFRKGYDLRHIAELLGLSTVRAAKRLVDEDPIKLGSIVARVI